MPSSPRIVMNDSIFHETSERISLLFTYNNMKGYSQDFVPHSPETRRNLAVKGLSPPHLTALFVLPGQAYSFGSQQLYVQQRCSLFIAQIQKSLLGLVGSICVRHIVNTTSLVLWPQLFKGSRNSLSLLYPLTLLNMSAYTLKQYAHLYIHTSFPYLIGSTV